MLKHFAYIKSFNYKNNQMAPFILILSWPLEMTNIERNLQMRRTRLREPKQFVSEFS